MKNCQDSYIKHEAGPSQVGRDYFKCPVSVAIIGYFALIGVACVTYYIPRLEIAKESILLFKILKNIVIVLATMYLVNRSQISRTISMSILLAILAIILICTGIALFADFFDFLFLISCLSVGLVEELIFRHYLFGVFIGNNPTPNFKHTIFSALGASLLFGLAHFTSFMKWDYVSVINQVFFAFAIGFFFQAIYIRFHGVLLPVIVHTLVNFWGGRAYYSPDEAIAPTQTPEGAGTFNLIFILCAILFVFGFYLFLKTYHDKSQIDNKSIKLIKE